MGDAFRDAVSRLSAWVRRTFPGQEKAFWGAIIGLVAAIVFLAVGPWPLVGSRSSCSWAWPQGAGLDGDPGSSTR